MSIPSWQSRIFSKICGDIHSSRCTTREKIRKVLLGHLWVVELTYTYNIDKFLPSSSLKDVSSLILFPLFATGVIDIWGKFATGVNDTNGTSGKIYCLCHWYWWQIFGHRCCKIYRRVIDTSGKFFATGVVHSCGAPWLANNSTNFWTNSKWP